MSILVSRERDAPMTDRRLRSPGNELSVVFRVRCSQSTPPPRFFGFLARQRRNAVKVLTRAIVPEGRGAAMAAQNFSQALSLLLIHEGGLSDDPHDPGGRTYQGILQTEYDAYRRSKGIAPRDVAHMDAGERDEIYRRQYWDAIHGDDLPSGLDYVLFDGAVNSGVTQSVKWLQRALPYPPVNGHLGQTILAAVAQVPDLPTLIESACEARREFLQNLRTFRYFGKGWLTRVHDVEQTAVAWATGGAAPVVAAPAVPHGKALRENASNPPSTALGAALTAASGAAIAATLAANGQIVAVAPSAVTPAPTISAPAASPAAPTAHTTPTAAKPAPKLLPPTATPHAASAKPSVGIASQPPHVITITNNQYTVALGVLVALFALGLFLMLSSRRARTGHADALGDNPLPTTALRLEKHMAAYTAAHTTTTHTTTSSPPRVAAPPRPATSIYSVPLVQSTSSRVLSSLWIAGTIVVNVIALASLLQAFGLAHENWHQPFTSLGNLYDQYAKQGFAVTSAAAQQRYGVTLPQWLLPILVLYVSMASAFVVASTGLMRRDTTAETMFGAIVHAGWIFAVPAFVLDAIRYHVVARFARQNTVLFFSYLFLMVAAFVGARFINDDFLAGAPAQSAAMILGHGHSTGPLAHPDKRKTS